MGPRRHWDFYANFGNLVEGEEVQGTCLGTAFTHKELLKNLKCVHFLVAQQIFIIKVDCMPDPLLG